MMMHVATILGPIGLRGMVKLYGLLSGENERLFAHHPVTIRTKTGDILTQIHLVSRMRGPLWRATIEGVGSRTQAEALRDCEVEMQASALPVLEEGEFYVRSLEGLAVHDPAGCLIGHIQTVHNFGAGDLVDILFTDGTSEMFHFSDEAFPTIDLLGGVAVFVRPEMLVI